MVQHIEHDLDWLIEMAKVLNAFNINLTIGTSFKCYCPIEYVSEPVKTVLYKLFSLKLIG